MKRLIALLTGAILAAGLLTLVPGTPASAAETDVCVGAGTATVDPGLYSPGGPLRKNAAFSFTLSGYDVAPGTCAFKASVSANGSVSGHCGLSAGAGTTSQGHDFIFVGIGSMLVVAGEVVGLVNATPDIPNGESCVPPAAAPTNDGANRFIVTGASILVASNLSGPIANPVQGVINGL